MSPQWAGMAHQMVSPATNVVFPTFSSGLNPQYRYLAAHAPNTPPALLVMFHETDTPSGHLESWLTAEQQTVQTLGGLLHATHGLPTDLLPVGVNAAQSIAFTNLPEAAQPVLERHLVSWPALQWYQIPGRYPHVFAVAQHRGRVQTVYNYRCWADGACLHTYRWPMDYQAPPPH